MSQENVDVERKFNDAFRRGDWEAMAATLDAHVLVRTDVRWPEQRIYGREAVIAFYRDVSESWGPDVCIEEVVDLGDRLLLRICTNVRGPHSGVAGEQRFSAITTYRDGRAVLIEFFLEHEQARQALGLI
jgi:ketosteroid isomerase-like protein